MPLLVALMHNWKFYNITDISLLYRTVFLNLIRDAYYRKLGNSWDDSSVMRISYENVISCSCLIIVDFSRNESLEVAARDVFHSKI